MIVCGGGPDTDASGKRGAHAAITYQSAARASSRRPPAADQRGSDSSIRSGGSAEVVATKCEAAFTCFMFMFRRRRTALAKRLWKARVRCCRDNETRCAEKTCAGAAAVPATTSSPHAHHHHLHHHHHHYHHHHHHHHHHNNHHQPSSSSSSSSLPQPPTQSESDERQFRNALFKRLDDRQLETLLRAVDTGGADAAECVAVRPFLFADPAVICCRLWRWPDLRNAEQLKNTPACSLTAKRTPDTVCCNPFHWSKRCEIERPPPPYSRFVKEKLKPEDRAPSECSWDSSNEDELRGSFSTDGDEKPNEQEWCKVAYWELSQRVGRLFPVDTKSVNVFWNVPLGTGLSLATLTQHNLCPAQSPPESVLRNRTKIGLGLALSREEDGVWAYNLSDWPMFVNSPTLDDPDSKSYLVFRVPSGHCLNIFTGNPHGDRIRYSNGVRVGPVDPNAVRISFAKGWGPKYSRQEITSCPTWIEVLLDPCR